MRRVPKWSIQGRSLFCRITHYCSLWQASLIKRLANCLNLTIHHCRWSYDICARPCVAYRNIGKSRNTPVVVHLSIRNEPAVTMGCILAEADIRDYCDFVAKIFANGGNRFLNNSFLVKCRACLLVFFQRQSKQNNGLYVEL